MKHAFRTRTAHILACLALLALFRIPSPPAAFAAEPESPEVSKAQKRQEELQSKAIDMARTIWLNDPLFELMQELDPQQGQELRYELYPLCLRAVSLNESVPPESILMLKASCLGDALRVISRASDESAAEFIRYLSSLLDALTAHNPELVLSLTGSAKTQEPLETFGDFLSVYLVEHDQHLDFLAEILDSALHRPQRIPDPEQSMARLRVLIAELAMQERQKYGEAAAPAIHAFLGEETTEEVDRAVLADVHATYYRLIAALPEQECGKLVRHLYAD